MHRLYFDHAATTPLDREVLTKMLPYFTEIYGNADSPHGIGRAALNAVDSARDKIAALIGAKPNEVYFTSGGTEADNWAMLVGAYAQKAQGKTHVIVSSVEHHAVLESAARLERAGFAVTYLPVNADGCVEISDLKNALTERTGLVALMAVNNETGVVQPIEEAARLARENGSLFFTDAVQAAPYMRLDVKTLGADLLSFSSHKFYGPKGAGVLYIRNGIKTERLIVGGEQERGLRGGTTNVPAIVGLAAAYERTLENLTATNEKLTKLKALFLQEIASLEGVYRNGGGACIPTVLNLRFDGVENSDFLYNMDIKGICVAAGSACASASIKPSHVLTAMKLTEGQAKNSVRFSFGKENTEEEVHILASATKEVVERLRRF